MRAPLTADTRPIHRYSEPVLEVLACPYCQRPLGPTVAGGDRDVTCEGCGSVYSYAHSGAIDLRLQKEKEYLMTFRLGARAETDPDCDVMPLGANPVPEVNFAASAAPKGLTRELLSYFPKARLPGSLALDIGCGQSPHRKVCEDAGFEYVGVDYASPNASMMADAHTLPFQDNVFEFVLLCGLLEHLHFPFVAVQEACRVLKPGGKMIGTVAFLEPFHGNSLYHHSHLGTLHTLRSASFHVDAIGSQKEWTVLIAQARMGLFHRIPPWLAQALVTPLQTLHRLWWGIGSLLTHGDHRALEWVRIRNTAGKFSFVCTKEPPIENIPGVLHDHQ